MRAFVQRVLSATVSIDGAVHGSIGPGLMVLLGVARDDGPKDVEWLAAKLLALRIFEDAEGRMNRSVVDTGGGILLVSQFTLHAETRRGNRPGFSAAARPGLAEPLYQSMAARLAAALGPGRFGTGVFGARMEIAMVADGPVSIPLDTDWMRGGEA
jgi:D-tyrosyl-tRNA(Tyr) deacylase